MQTSHLSSWNCKAEGAATRQARRTPTTWTVKAPKLSCSSRRRSRWVGSPGPDYRRCQSHRTDLNWSGVRVPAGMSAKTKSERLKRFVSHGYFAPELPPCFVSEDLAKFRKSILAGIDALPPTRRGNPGYHGFISEPAWLYFPRFGTEDRRHGVPNPIAHLLLSRALADNYVDLRRKARASKVTLSPPVFDWSGSRALMRPSVDPGTTSESISRPVVRSMLRQTSELSFTRFTPMPSLGRSTARISPSTAESQLGALWEPDRPSLPNAQDGQTMGLPVGPDTSRLVASSGVGCGCAPAGAPGDRGRMLPPTSTITRQQSRRG